MTSDRPPLICDRCSAVLHPGRGDHYVVGIVAVADPAAPTFTEEDLARDVGRELDRLIKRLDDLGQQEALDQVYRRRVLYLCVPCYERWIEDPTGP
jgi:hypothetical protein